MQRVRWSPGRAWGAPLALAILAGTLAGCGGGGSGKNGSCNNGCTASGATQCSGLEVQTCAADSSGCLAWSAASACPNALTCNAAQGKCIDHPVTISWAANRETGVNGAGGGYRVSISGQPTIDVPYASGASAPTSMVAHLPTGSYVVTVKAYAALDAQGGSNGSSSAASQSIPVSVP